MSTPPRVSRVSPGLAFGIISTTTTTTMTHLVLLFQVNPSFSVDAAQSVEG